MLATSAAWSHGDEAARSSTALVSRLISSTCPARRRSISMGLLKTIATIGQLRHAHLGAGHPQAGPAAQLSCCAGGAAPWWAASAPAARVAVWTVLQCSHHYIAVGKTARNTARARRVIRCSLAQLGTGSKRGEMSSHTALHTTATGCPVDMFPIFFNRHQQIRCHPWSHSCSSNPLYFETPSSLPVLLAATDHGSPRPLPAEVQLPPLVAQLQRLPLGCP